MYHMDLICRQSANLINGPRPAPCNSNQLYLGRHHEICLFFELPADTFFGRIQKARLLLFKIPFPAVHPSSLPQCNWYRACPLLDFFSSYSNCYTPPKSYGKLTVNYEDQAAMAYTEINITAIVKAWLRSQPENKGLLLSAHPDARRLVYASAQHELIGMRPLLRLTYEGPSLPLSVAPCVVRVNEK